MSTFNEIGGEDTLGRVMDSFFTRLQSDTREPAVWRHFEGRTPEEMQQISEHISGALRGLLSGDLTALPIPSAELRDKMDLTIEDFGVMIGHLVGALEQAEAHVALPVIAPYIGEVERGLVA